MSLNRNCARLVLAVVAVGILAGCAHRDVTAQAREGQSIQLDDAITVSRNARQMRYIGEMTAAGLLAMKALARGTRIDELVITSSGGEINVGMDFGDWVYEQGMSVVVEEYCLSSCANYIFTAAWQKFLPPGAVVAWHGSARQQDLPDQLVHVVDDQIQALALKGQARERERDRRRREVSAYLTRAIARQDAFFERIGVSEYVTRVGKERFGIDGLYTLSAADMRRFGIQNVLVPQGEETGNTNSVQQKLDMRIVRLKLDETPLSSDR